MSRAGKQHIVRIRESIYEEVRRKKQEEGRIEGVNQYIENVLSAFVRGALKAQELQKGRVRLGQAEIEDSESASKISPTRDEKERRKTRHQAHG